METILLYLQHHLLAQYIVLGVLSLCIGSFLNVVIYRLPIILNAKWADMSRDFLNISHEREDTTSLILPRSQCPQCNKLIKAWQNIPLLSFCLLRGKCFYCKHPISLRYPLVELLTACCALIVLSQFGFTLKTVWGLIFIYCLIPLAFIDIKTQLLPDEITIPLIWLGLIANTQGLFVPLETAVISAVGAYITLWAFISLFYVITGKEGMGGGDLKLFSALGAWLGWTKLPLIILCSSLIGAIIGLSIIKWTKRDKDTPLPFGPYLCLSGFIALLWGEDIIQWYLSTL